MKTGQRLLKLALVTSALACALALPTLRSSARQDGARGLTSVRIRVEDGKELKLYDRSYALVIGVSDYTHWPKLPGVKRDVEEVARALERHGFLVTKVENPDSAQLDKVFKTFIDTYGLGVENRLLFYFAGHGHTVRQSYGEEMGYIVPADAPLPTRDAAGFMSKAMDMQQMELYARRIQSKHALFLFDSCFSGAIFALSRAVPDAITYKTARPVRQFITSGSADEQVPDESVFRRQLVEALDGEADLNRDDYITGTELGEFLQDKVINYSRNAQHPQYGKLRNPNLDKGDFVFALPKKTAPPAVAVKPNVIEPASPAPARVDPAQQELAFWNSVQNSTDPEDFKDYLEQYPAGLYAGIARRKLAALTSAAKPAPATPAGGGAATNTTGAARPASPKPVVTTRIGMELVYVPAGSFMMGSKKLSNEMPVHEVTISKGFYMGRYEVTQEQWQKVMRTNPSSLEGDNLPVENVSWLDTQEFIRKLNEMNDGYTYRLPTEAEWEYACRAGTTGDYAGELGAMAWYGHNASQTHPVGQKQPNAFGLYDMHGNVSEWCEDDLHNNYIGAPTDGSAWLGGGGTTLSGKTSKVLRGGSHFGGDDNCRSARREWSVPDYRLKLYGLRVVAVARQ